MVKSMTGYGVAKKTTDEWHCQVVVRSVNSRYLDLNFSIPKSCEEYDATLRQTVKENIARGKVRVDIHFFLADNPQSGFQIQADVLEGYIAALKPYVDASEKIKPSDVVALLQLPNALVKVEEDIPETYIQTLLLPTLKEAISAHALACADEGARLKQGLDDKIAQMTTILNRLSERAPELIDQYRERFLLRLERDIDAGQWDASRITQEVAIFAEKSAIDEEIVRLQSHLKCLHQLLTVSNEDTKGKKCDFYLQEMNREVNTIGSKVSDVQVTGWVVDMKDLIEKMREQVQNIM